MGSVIQIFTKRGKGAPRIEGSVAGGNLNTFEEKLSVSGGTGQIGYSLAVGRTDTDGSLPINNAFRETTVSGRIDYQIEKALDLNFTVRYTDSEFQFPTGGAGDRFDPLDPHQFSDRQRWLLSGKASHALSPWWRQTFQLGWYQQNFDTDDRFDPCCDFSTLRSRNEERRFSLDYFWNLTAPTVLDVTNVLTAGVGYEWEGFDQRTDGTDTPFPFSSSNKDSRDNKGFYLQNQLDWKKRLFVTAGFRVDDNTKFGTEVTPRISVAYVVPITETKIRGSYGEGIKAPSFIENFCSIIKESL